MTTPPRDRHTARRIVIDIVWLTTAADEQLAAALLRIINSTRT